MFSGLDKNWWAFIWGEGHIYRGLVYMGLYNCVKSIFGGILTGFYSILFLSIIQDLEILKFASINTKPYKFKIISLHSLLDSVSLRRNLISFTSGGWSCSSISFKKLLTSAILQEQGECDCDMNPQTKHKLC